MSSKIRLNITEIKLALRQKGKISTIAELSKVIGVTPNALLYWSKVSVPDQLVMCYDISKKAKNLTLTELIKMLGNNYPVINLLKLYNKETGFEVERVIIKD